MIQGSGWNKTLSQKQEELVGKFESHGFIMCVIKEFKLDVNPICMIGLSGIRIIKKIIGETDRQLIM